MFYQNSNDLVKNASLKSGNVQHSRETQQLLASQQVMNPPNDGGAGAGAEVESRTGADGGAGASLSIGAQFQNMIQELVSAFSMKEGYVGGGGDGKTSQPYSITNDAAYDKKYTKQELNHINKTKGILDLIEKEDKTTRQNWVEVTDAVGVTKYGYITKDGVFQIWHAPSSPSANPSNWLETDKMKQNATTVIGCPASTSSIQKIKIAGKWDDIKPYDQVYSDTDKSRTNPVFMMINNGVRDPRNTVGGKGLFSCGNESGNVYVTERPSADFQFPASGVDTIQIGCYVLGDNVTDSDLKNRGFIYQMDLNEASISQCKRRAEDLGSSYFLVGAPQTKSAPNNRGSCWIYTGSGKPNINGIMTFDEKGSKCHTMSNQEDDEDHYLKEYTTTNLKRMYGKNTTLQFPLNPPNPECDHTTRSRCIFKDYHHIGGAICYPKNWNGRWAYGGLYNYSKQDLKGWLQALHDRNADGLERAAVNEYIEKCKRTQGYELLDDNPQWRTKIVRSVALYSLKTGGPNGVDQVNRGGRGYVGRIAYIDHNGERHDYPASALSMMAPSKDQNGITLPASYLNLGGYDTRSTESSYNIEEAQTKKVEFTYMYGPWITGSDIATSIKFLDDGRAVYMIQDDGYTKMVSEDNQEKYYQGNISDFNPANWNSYSNTGGGKYLLKKTGKYGVYNIVSKGQPILSSMDKCRQLCDNSEKCGGFVYTKGNAGADGKCELKDRDKMYPVGLRVADPTKQLMLKVPTINETISDEACKVGNGAYTMINSAHYAHYPDTGSMISNTKCNIRNIIPKEGSLKPSNLTSMFGAVDKAFADTNNNTAEYANQTAVPAPQPEMTGNITEGMTIQQKDDIFYTDASNNYGQAMKGVQDSLVKIANSKYQRERLLAMTEESNKNLISESYKFILWSILAILAVMALLKLKEMFGEDDADGDGGDGMDGGGLLATILGWFGVKSVSTNDIPDRTEDVKSALSSAGQQLSETGTNLATGITEGADNLVNSANNMATGVVEGATNLVDKAKETASNAIDQVGTAASSATSAIGIGSTSSAPAAASSPTTGGRKTSSVSKSKKK